MTCCNAWRYDGSCCEACMTKNSHIVTLYCMSFILTAYCILQSTSPVEDANINGLLYAKRPILASLIKVPLLSVKHGWQRLSHILTLYCMSLIPTTYNFQPVPSKKPKWIILCKNDGITFLQKIIPSFCAKNDSHWHSFWLWSVPNCSLGIPNILNVMIGRRTSKLYNILENGSWTSLSAMPSSKKRLDHLWIMKWSNHF